MSKPSPKHSRAGFTLLEVVIALAILGTGMVMLLESHFGTLSLFSDAQDAATLEILSKQGTALAEVEILTGETSGDGDFGEAYPGYSYEYMTEVIDEFELPGLMRVDFVLHAPSDEVEFNFRVYDGAMEYEK